MIAEKKSFVSRLILIGVSTLVFSGLFLPNRVHAASCEEKISQLGNTYCEAIAGDKDAQYRIGRWYLGGSDHAADYKEAMKWFKKAAAKPRVGRGVNSGGAGTSYGTVRDERMARSSMKDRHSGALYEIGLLYLDGKGVKQSGKKAKKYIKLAAKEGNREALARLAELEKNE